MDFIHDIYKKNISESIHRKFVKYGIGEFERETLFLKAGSSVQIQAGIDYLDIVFFLLGEVAEKEVMMSGDIITNEDIATSLKAFGIEPTKTTPKKYTIKETMTPQRFSEFLQMFSPYYLLLSAKSDKNSISVKKSLPQKGNLIEKFVSAKFDKKFYEKIKNDFLFDWEGDFKNAEIHHTYHIEELVVAPELLKKDAAKARLEAKRKGKIIREKIVDGQKSRTEIEMLV